MNTLALPSFEYRNSRVVQFFRTTYEGSPTLTWQAMALVLGFILCFVLQFIDARALNGANVWLKPGKFFLSMSVHFLTISWALSLLPQQQRKSRVVSWSVMTVSVAAWTELIYIALQASRGEASHFNVATPLTAALYAVMAIFAILLVVAPAIVGINIWRAVRNDLWAQSVAIGFCLAAFLTIGVGMTLGGNSGHWIGGDLNDATGLPIFKWSTTGGDLRVSHFISLHAMQIVPFAAFSRRRSVVWGVAIVLTIATALTFFQALSGTPFLRV